MNDPHPATRHVAPPVVRSLDLTAKAGLLVLLTIALLFPDLGHMRGKAAGLRAVTYPVLAFSVPALWYVFWRDRASFPWVADLLVTLTCFTDTLGNRMNMYDTVVWFDDWIHFMNTGFLTAGVILLTMHRNSTLRATLERALAFGATVAIGWEIAEYYAFISTSSERRGAYTDTLGDLFLGTSGSVVAALTVHSLWRMGRLASAAPQLEPMRV
jgi:glycopeptide antibiotics resistance protein